MQFGIFLVDRRVISAEQFVEAVRQQLQHRVPLGQLAIENGMLSVREVFEVLRAQSQAENEPFGETAIDRGMLTKAEVAELLLLQADRRPELPEILVELGYLTDEQYNDEMAAFRRSVERRGSGSSETAFTNQTASKSELVAVCV